MIAALFRVVDDASSNPGRSTTASDDALTTARVNKIREELGCELDLLKRRLALAWPRKVLAANEGEYDMAVDHVLAKQRATDLYDRLQERRAEILAALDRIEKGSYGSCAICSAPIPYRRLAVLPETTTCIRCSR